MLSRLAAAVTQSETDIPLGLQALEAAVEHFVGIMFVQRLRTPTDRQAVRDIFQKVWGRGLQPQERPSISVTPTTVRVGRAILPRADAAAAGGSSSEAGSLSAAASLRLLGSQLQPLEAAVQASPLLSAQSSPLSLLSS